MKLVLRKGVILFVEQTWKQNHRSKSRLSRHGDQPHWESAS